METFSGIQSRNLQAMPSLRSNRKTDRSFLVAILFFMLVIPSITGAAEQAEGVPLRIVSLSPIQTENVFLLGAGSQLVGNTTYCTKPEAARSIEKVGSVMEINIEKIAGLRPDLILASNLTSQLQVEQLNKLGLRAKTFHQASSFQEICDQFLTLGKLLGREQQAKRIIDEAQRRVDNVSRAVERFPKPKVFLQVGAHPLFSSVKKSFTNEYITLGGGENIAYENTSGAMSTEEVLALAPDLIIIAVMGSEDGIGANEKTKWLSYDVLKAAKTGRIYVLDPDQVCSPSPLTFAKALEDIARLIHPDAWGSANTRG